MALSASNMSILQDEKAKVDSLHNVTPEGDYSMAFFKEKIKEYYTKYIFEGEAQADGVKPSIENIIMYYWVNYLFAIRDHLKFNPDSDYDMWNLIQDGKDMACNRVFDMDPSQFVKMHSFKDLFMDLDVINLMLAGRDDILDDDDHEYPYPITKEVEIDNKGQSL